jgi:hypothetical protein
MINGRILYANSSVLLLVIVIVSLISIFIDIPEDQIIDTAKASLDDDHSNSMNEKQNMVMSIKNRSSVVNNVNSNFAPIFDGKTLNGWEMAGDGRFVKVESDAALQSEGGMGLLWYSEKIYKNFTLKLEWKVSDESDNSGVFVRFPDPDNNPNNAVREGYEIQRDDKAADSIHQTGAIYDFAAPDKVVSNPPGQWNTMEIQTQDQSYTVIINGQKVTQFTGSGLNEGYI